MPPAPSKVYPQWGCAFCERSYISPNLVTRHQDGYLTEYARIYHPDGPTTFRATAHPLPVLRYVRHEADRHPGNTHANIVWAAVTFRPWNEPVPVMVRLDNVEAKRKHSEEFRYLTADQWIGRLGEIVPVEAKSVEEEEDDDEDDEKSKDEESDELEREPEDEDEEPDEDDDDGLQANQAEAPSTASSSPSPSPPSSASSASSGFAMHPITPQPRSSNRSHFTRVHSDRPIANSTVIGSHYEPISGNVARTATANVNCNRSAKRGERSRRTVHDDDDDGDGDGDDDDEDEGLILRDISPLSRKGKERAKRVPEPASASSSADPGPVNRPSTKYKGKGKAKRVVESSSPAADDSGPVSAAPTPKPPAKRHHAAATPIAAPTQNPTSATRASQFYTPGNTMPIFVRLSIVLGVYARPWIVPVAASSSVEEAVAMVRAGLAQRGIGGEGLPSLAGIAISGVTVGERAWRRLVRKGGVVGVELVWDS